MPQKAYVCLGVAATSSFVKGAGHCEPHLTTREWEKGVRPVGVPKRKVVLGSNLTGALPAAESPTNPYLRCVDIPRIAELCRAHGALVCIDSTFATPINQKAISLGADIVIHSATKYLAGHNDVMAGACSGSVLQQCPQRSLVQGGHVSVLLRHAAQL